MVKTKSTKEVVEEVSSSITKDTLDKIIKTCEYLVIPISTVAAIWGFDISTYVAAGMAVIISICTFAKLFIKE